MITPETLTAEMVRELLRSTCTEMMSGIEGQPWLERNELAGYCRVALGVSRSPRKGYKLLAKQRVCDALNARAAAQAPSDLAQACIQLGMTLSEEERAGFRAYADNAPPAGSTLARLRAEEAWEQGDRDAASATEHKLGCDCTTCCGIRVESVRAQARTL